MMGGEVFCLAVVVWVLGCSWVCEDGAGLWLVWVGRGRDGRHKSVDPGTGWARVGG